MYHKSPIERRPGKCGGNPVIRGTRIPISLLDDYVESGYSLDEFAETYGLDVELVKEAYSQKENTDHDRPLVYA